MLESASVRGRNYRSLGFFILILLTSALAACLDNNPGTPPLPLPTGTGCVVITAEPDSLQAQWTLMGPESYIHLGYGSDSLSDMAPGRYSIHWSLETCWALSGADSATAVLAAGDTVTFGNSYAPHPGGCGRLIIHYSFWPDDYNSLTVPWTLTGSGGYLKEGKGEQLLDMIPPGDYTITWQPPTGFLLLYETSEATLAPGAVEILDAVFKPDYSQMGTVVITSYPTNLNISWSLQGPGKIWSGSRAATIEHVVPGHYSLTWGEIAGWSPATEPVTEQFLEPNQALSFTATFCSDEPLAVPNVEVHPGLEPGQVVVSWQRLLSSRYPVQAYLVATDTSGPLTEEDWDQADLLARQDAEPDREDYALTFSTADDGLVPGVPNWFAVRALTSTGQLSPVDGQWSVIPTIATTIDGRVQDQAGSPVAGITVEAIVADGPPLRARTDASGTFYFPAVLNNVNVSLRTLTSEDTPGSWFDYYLYRPAGVPLTGLVLPLLVQHPLDDRCNLSAPDFLTYLRAMTKTVHPTTNRPNTNLYKWDHWPLTVYLPADDTPVEVDFQAQSRWALEIWNTTMPEIYFTETTDPEAADVVFLYSDRYTANGQVSVLEPAGGYVIGDIIPRKMEVFLHNSMDSDQRVAEVALHELGHAIGIADHSLCSQAGYLMYITSAGALDNGPEHAIHPDEQALVEAIRHLPQGLDMNGFQE